MDFLNHEESTNGIPNTTGAVDPGAVDPLSPLPTTHQLQLHNNDDTAATNMNMNMNTTIPIIEKEESDDNDNNDDFTANHHRSRLRSFLRYTRAILTLLSAFLLDLTSANNASIVSKIVKLFLTTFTYAVVYTSATGQLLWAIAYLMDHAWYLLAVTCSIVLMLGCGIVLAFYEWMWRWQERVLLLMGGNSNNNNNSGNIGGYDRLRSVNILDDDEMEDDLSLRAWIKRISHALISCLIWSLYCVLNVKVDFWITDQYVVARPVYYQIELRLVNCFEAAPILMGAALLLYYAYPSFYRWNFHREQLSIYSTNNNGTVVEPFASTGNSNHNHNHIIVDDEDDEMAMRMQQSLII